MDSNPPTSQNSLLTLLIAPILFILLWLITAKPFGKKKLLAPPKPSGSWPIIGHLPLLSRSQQPTHLTLGSLADKYGPIYMINFGVHKALVISNSEMAKECLSTNDKAFANRPKSLVSEIFYNYSMLGFAPYGPYWRESRKILTIEVLSNFRLEKLRHVREAEIKEAIESLYRSWTRNKNGVVVDMKKWFSDITLNIILKIVVGQRYANFENVEEVDSGWRHALRETMEWAGKNVVSDAVPFLRFLDLGGMENGMKKTIKELDDFIQRWLDDHRQKWKNKGVEKGEGEDFIYVMLSILGDTKEFFDWDANTFIKSTCLVLIIAASDTTMITLTWALSLLLNNKDALKKAQDELDLHVGRERQVQESDVKNLVYLQAIIKETLRLYPAAPLSLPHESMEDCIVGGYHVPARTRMIVNFSKIHRDPQTWEKPDRFQPDRFLTTHKAINVRGQNFELLPFGSGRRMCPGLTFALQILHLTLASLLHGFEIGTPSNKPVDMTEGFGITSLKVTPLEALLTPRLPAHMYT